MSESKMTTGRLGRLTRLAKLGARTGASALFSKDGAGAAESAAEVLGLLRGIAAKVGQMASYVEGMVPDEHRAAYEKSLKVLRDAAPRSSAASIRKVVESELGRPIEELFATWEDEPFASASIGQVHAATLADGTELAVKVQHPGIERAIAADLDNASMFEGAIRMLGPRVLETKATFDVVRARFTEELDYHLEAARQQAFAKLHDGDPSIRIPRVYEELSARRVLTSERVRGWSLDEAAGMSEAMRASYSETLWRFVFKGNLVGGMFNADPHPGNYVFHDDGTVSFLDFGCVQLIEEGRRKEAVAMHVAAIARDEEAYADGTRTMLGLRGGRYEAFALGFTRRLFEPLFGSPFRFTPGYVSEVVQRVRDGKREMMGKGANFVTPPPDMIFMNRLQFGFYSVLARLDSEVDYARIERDFLTKAGLIAITSA